MEVRNLNAIAVPIFSIFPTKIGWMGLVGRRHRVDRLVFGHSSAEGVWDRLISEIGTVFQESDWNPELRDGLESYAEGEFVDFSEIPVDLSHLTNFQHRVVSALRKVPYGQTVSYAELAERAGSPKAARAVGTVMAKNRVPLILPCHRVVGSGGRLGGFSAPRGVSLKQELLALENQHAAMPG